MEKKNYTSQDVADMAGVSQSTVSRVFAGNTNVSAKKRKKILEVAEKLDYQPNAIARGLITNKTKMVGIVIKYFHNPFYSEVLSAFYNRLSSLGYHLIFINSDNDEIQASEINLLIDYKVEGVIITDAILSSSAAKKLSRNNTTVVLFNRYIKDSESKAVYCDNYFAGRQLATYLVEMGHKSIAFISGPFNTSTTIDRKQGFEEVLAERGLPPLHVESGIYTYESGFKAAQALVAMKEKVDCIFCANDITALGAIEAIREMGLSIPEDISVVGFDDINMANWPSYSLTTWKQPIDEMVDNAVKLLLGEETNQENVVKLKGNLVIRKSVKAKK
ncbi:LacI family DNA-binding transcriptional regulator [Chitinophaga niabensis]|uniref:DNA-binding transcriptional regulator, LacI/PurR family n=1 Tax=Chitinophaga niabensis TaxID=536979 RepID=A0A1N6KDU5_9BACT|nr:LacI family DNA-binding transcriptional regulator [Chitinophaga niabensis]SIO54769.1 DNA-binding transcriptional regulator, LacI/PurR family [Chitinophaga niabensis]